MAASRPVLAHVAPGRKPTVRSSPGSGRGDAGGGRRADADAVQEDLEALPVERARHGVPRAVPDGRRRDGGTRRSPRAFAAARTGLADDEAHAAVGAGVEAVGGGVDVALRTLGDDGPPRAGAADALDQASAETVSGLSNGSSGTRKPCWLGSSSRPSAKRPGTEETNRGSVPTKPLPEPSGTPSAFEVRSSTWYSAMRSSAAGGRGSAAGTFWEAR